MLCWIAQPLPQDAAASTQPSTLGSLMELGSRLAGQTFDASTEVSISLAELFSIAARHPHAVGLLGVSAKPTETDPDGRQLDRLEMVVAIDTGGSNDEILRLLQQTVRKLTDKDAATLLTDQADGFAYQTLADRRLPAWCVVSWGTVENHFVITLGGDQWPRAIRAWPDATQSIAEHDWLREARAHRSIPAPALIEIYAHYARLCEALDPVTDGRASAFFAAWRASEMHEALWTLGFDGNALFCNASLRSADSTSQRSFTARGAPDTSLVAWIPDGARYAVYPLPAADVLRSMSESVLAWRGQRGRQVLEQFFAEIANANELIWERDLLARLGDRIILHNWPLHPLRVPMACTILVEIRGDERALAKTLDSLFGSIRARLQQAAAEGGSWGWLGLDRERDFWFIRMGPLAGPALTIREGYVILCWSPAALAQYLSKVGQP
jgi:hypothetical protein